MEIHFQNIGKVWPDGTPALHEVELTVPAGQFCVLLGHSGAGKSTLLRCVNGLETPTSGGVCIDGQPVDRTSLPALRRRIAMVHQHFGLVPRASGAANVMAGAVPVMPLWRVLTGLYPAASRRRVCDLLKAVGLDEVHLRRRAEQLSGGQQQRLGLARAFMLDPAILLADEPVASLDPALAREVLGLLKAQAREHGSTVLCSLHQLDLARAFADRIVALHRGRVIFDGAPDTLNTRDLAVIYARDDVPLTDGVLPLKEAV
ncbi:phosphonate ABC transporter ATP-binding protein [Novosphingobium mangrovi (ex Huang et al. 2023)]|uniref:Phosphonate ABC transporter ATP-binding protein n=1 Tax=Novosphingobium mangrovi (ex Huang et al. 2023) TaxID=2976432 RepID=A0ABT2IA83_9SPHN|nr:phosphonate ABC transporter ATP-binding protein [Novosphingobium mangrovi (ex Huang et al. 2023)]MCT2401473.1 phosphonate ABC transporter ATP-binding protein [Novosphingobium mangrovi (ex Huang et al. 2023)]